MQLNCAHRHLFEDIKIISKLDMRVFIALSALLCGCNGLMFHSEAVTKEWDTWVFVENSTYYAYYLVTEVKKMYISPLLSLSSFSPPFLTRCMCFQPRTRYRTAKALEWPHHPTDSTGRTTDTCGTGKCTHYYSLARQ